MDWYSQGARAADEIADAAARRSQSECEKPRKAGVPQWKCKEAPHRFEWNPEPKRVGFDGIFPYVRLGKRCVVAVGFFGCTLDELPEGNGHLFDHLHEPDRLHSSVPDLPQVPDLPE